MRELSIALCLIVQGDEYILQFRNGDPKIGAANLIGCFGGKIEPGEEPLAAICRELAEETSLRPGAIDFEELGIVRAIADYKLQDVKIKAHVFKLQTNEKNIQAAEGQLIRIARRDIAGKLAQMTPGTKAIFEQYVLGLA